MVAVTTNSELESAMKNSSVERLKRRLSITGERHIILLREGFRDFYSTFMKDKFVIKFKSSL